MSTKELMQSVPQRDQRMFRRRTGHVAYPQHVRQAELSRTGVTRREALPGHWHISRYSTFKLAIAGLGLLCCDCLGTPQPLNGYTKVRLGNHNLLQSLTCAERPFFWQVSLMSMKNGFPL